MFAELKQQDVPYMTFAEAGRRYPDHWLVFINPDLDGDCELIGGQLVEAADTREGAYRTASHLKAAWDIRNFAIRCTKRRPDDLEYVL